MTMKKYIKPEITVVDIETESIMQASGNLDKLTDSRPTYDDDANNFSKSHTDIWGFDEDED